MIELYTINCPKCGILETKLKSKNIPFNKITDIELMKNLGIIQLPVLSVNDNMLNYREAVKWVNEQNNKEGEK